MVTMSGGAFSRVMTSPLQKPARAPTPSANTIASGSGSPMFFQE